MTPRFSSTLSDYAALTAYAAYRNARRFTRKHPRMSLIGAAALAVGAFSAAGAAAGTTPWDEAFGNVAASTHVASGVLAGQAGNSIVDSVAGVKSPGAGHQSAHIALLESGPVGATPKVATASHPSVAGGAAAAVHGAAAAAGARAPQPQPPAAHAPAAKVPAAHAAPGHPAHPAHPAPQRPLAHTANPHLAPAHSGPPPTYLIYDSVNPSVIPAGKSVGAYANGMYRASGSALAATHSNVLWIDVNGSSADANVLDVEPGDATPAGAALWVKARLTSHPNSVAIVYTFQNAWPAVKHYVGTLPSWMQSKVRYWIADPTGVPHVLPGASATQWYWGKTYDISTANLDFQVP